MARTSFQMPFQDALADGPEHETEDPSFKVLALAQDDDVNIGRPV
jgi:hypothetical protein